MKLARWGVFFLINGLFFASCTAPTVLPDESLEVNAIIQISEPPPDHGFQFQWEMVDQPISDTKCPPFMVYAMKLTSQETLIIGSILDDDTDKLKELSIPVQIRDDTKMSNIISQYSLASLGEVQYWALMFESRSIGSSKLYLIINKTPIKQNLTIGSLHDLANHQNLPRSME